MSDGPVALHLVRSQVDRGRASVDAEFARSMPGVLAVLTPADMVGRSLPGGAPVLADQIEYQGQPVAAVVAETEYAAADAAEAVDVTVTRDDVDVGRRSDAAGETHVENGDSLTCVLDQPRWHVAPLQTNSCLAVPDGSDGVVARASARDPRRFAAALADSAGVQPARIRVDPLAQTGRALIAADVVHPGHVAVVAAALRLGRTVRWQESRAESMTSGGAQTGYHLIAKLDGTPPDATLRMRLAVDVGTYALPSMLDDGELMDLPWYGFDTVHLDVQERHSRLPPAHIDVARILARVTAAESALGLLSRLTGEPLARLQGQAAAAGGPDSVALLESADASAEGHAPAGVALAPGIAAAVMLTLDRGTGEWSPTSVVLSVCGETSAEVGNALRAGAVDGYGVAAMQQIPFDEQGTCLAATLMDYVMPSSAEAPAVSIREVQCARAGALEPGLARALATAAVVAAARNALTSVIPGLAGVPGPVRSSDAWEAAWA
jgi:CO/xanthine dehydrogenase Mo-binding subunit